MEARDTFVSEVGISEARGVSSEAETLEERGVSLEEGVLSEAGILEAGVSEERR